MANYYGNSKTNYFRVTDEKRFEELYEGLVGEWIEDLTKTVNGEKYHCFGGDSLSYYDENIDEYDFDYFLEELQKILPDNEVFVYMESGHEKMDVSGWCVVVTNKEIKNTSLHSYATEQAKSMIGPDVKICWYSSNIQETKQSEVNEEKDNDYEM